MKTVIIYEVPKLVTNRKMTITSEFADMTSSSNFFEFVLLHLSSLVAVPSFVSISSLVLKLRRFTFTKDWPEIQKSEISPSEFYPISGDWANFQGYNFYCFCVIKGKPTGG